MGSQNEYDGIDIRVTGVDGGYYTDTTEALVLNNQTLNVKGKGKFVSIINTAQNKQIDNNGGIYAKGGSTVNFTDVDSIYIAAIAGKEGGNDSTVISAKDPGRDLTGYTNIVNISGTTVQLIGSIDVMHSLGSVFSIEMHDTQSMPPCPVLTLFGMAALLAKLMNALQLISRSLMVPL